jgi:hypothetical protein
MKKLKIRKCLCTTAESLLAVSVGFRPSRVSLLAGPLRKILDNVEPPLPPVPELQNAVNAKGAIRDAIERKLREQR